MSSSRSVTGVPVPMLSSTELMSDRRGVLGLRDMGDWRRSPSCAVAEGVLWRPRICRSVGRAASSTGPPARTARFAEMSGSTSAGRAALDHTRGTGPRRSPRQDRRRRSRHHRHRYRTQFRCRSTGAAGPVRCRQHPVGLPLLSRRGPGGSGQRLGWDQRDRDQPSALLRLDDRVERCIRRSRVSARRRPAMGGTTRSGRGLLGG